MYWVDNGTGVTAPPTIPPVQSSVRQYFTEGGQGQQPTIPGGEWFNMMTDELLSVLSAAGISPSKVEHTQLLLSIQKLIERKTKYGCPLIGELIHWPHQLMPHEIFTDIGMTFIPYIGQPFDKAKFPLLAMIHPSGVLPADMRGEHVVGLDNGRGVDSGRVLMSWKPSTGISDFQGDGGLVQKNYFTDVESTVTAGAGFTAYGGKNAGALGTTMYNRVRVRDVAWNEVVRVA